MCSSPIKQTCLSFEEKTSLPKAWLRNIFQHLFIRYPKVYQIASRKRLLRRPLFAQVTSLHNTIAFISKPHDALPSISIRGHRCSETKSRVLSLQEADDDTQLSSCLGGHQSNMSSLLHRSNRRCYRFLLRNLTASFCLSPRAPQASLRTDAQRSGESVFGLLNFYSIFGCQY